MLKDVNKNIWKWESCNKAENYRKKLEKDTKISQSRKIQIEFELDLLKQDEKYVMTFIDWFYDLKRELWERFAIKIDDFEKFTYVVNDFKKNGFDIAKIMEKYISAISLDDKIKKDNTEIQMIYHQKIELNKFVTLWQDESNQHQQTMNINYQLENMNLGFQEVKQLRFTILEIAEANNISPDKAFPNSLKTLKKNIIANLV